MPLNNGGIAPGITQNLLKSRLDSFHTQTRQQSLFAGDSAERNPVRLQRNSGSSMFADLCQSSDRSG